MSSRFLNVKQGNPIEVFALTKSFLEDAYEKKVNLGVGAYRTDAGKPWVLPIVKHVEQKLAQDASLNKEYLPILGLESFSKAATRLLLGQSSKAIAENRAFGIQTLSGTGALRIAAEFLKSVLNYSTYYYSQQTWGNHKLIFTKSGFTDSRQYRYWSEKTKNVDFDAMVEDLNQAPENSVIILHSCAHNPTGCDLNENQWQVVADVCQARKLFPFFDSAYQGFATGDIDNDAKAVRIFADRGFEMFVAQSFAKNFGLYNERVGNLAIVTSNSDHIEQIKSQMTIIIRGMYSNPPAHGAQIVSEVLNDPKLYEEWRQCVSIMANRIKGMRQELFDRLKSLKTPGNWDHITSQIGMFSFTGLTELQSQYMIEKHHIYMLKNGRINMCGLTSENIDYVAAAIHDTVTHVSVSSNKL